MQGLRKLFATIAVLALSASVHAANFPAPTGFVNDFAHVIDSQTNTQLTSILKAFESATSNEVTVATIPSLNNEPIENYAVEMYEEWGIGKKGKDNGVLILVAPGDRKMRIEVGYGLEQDINDALAGRIVRDTMIPHFRDGNFSLGILNGAVEVTSIIAKKENIQFDPIAEGKIEAYKMYHVGTSAKAETPFLAKVFKVIMIVLIILFFIKNPWAALFMLSSFGSGGGGSFRGGFGGGFGGFGGFGGGRSGGGGASGSW